MHPESGERGHNFHVVNSESGITILEILVVLVILSLIAVVGTIQVSQLMDRAKVDVTTLQLRQISNSLEVFRIDLRRYPTAEESLGVLVGNSGNIEGWRGPYLKDSALLLDPWGQAVTYTTSAGGGFELRSLGADRKEGGEGVASDIVIGASG
ncbi:MAG: type II secretion system major pseudopilin GspG [Devosia sp.]